MSGPANGGDLHLHTTHSDGTSTPEEVVALARSQQLLTIAITDHDAISGVASARDAAADGGPEVIAGVEFGTPADDPNFPEAHIVGLFLNPQHDELLASLEAWRGKRRERVGTICRKLAQIGIPLRTDAVFAQADRGTVGRLHVAKALMEQNYVNTIGEAFRTLIGAAGPAYVPRQCARAPELAALIHRAGGVAVLAHPAINVKDEELPAFVEAGIDAIEAFCPDHTVAATERYVRFAAENGLLVSGGSDFHGTNKSNQHSMGIVRLPAENVEALRNRAAQHAEETQHV